LINNKEEYNHSSDVKSSFGWVVSNTCLAKLWDGKKASLSLVTRISSLRFGLMGAKKALATLISLDLWNS